MKNDGFRTMDLSTHIVYDPKFRRIARLRPEHTVSAFVAYVTLLGECWRAGERLTIEDAWSDLVPYDPEVIESMQRVRLIDAEGRIPEHAWQDWFVAAWERREVLREKWRRANRKRAESAKTPRGDNGGMGGNGTATARSARGDQGGERGVTAATRTVNRHPLTRVTVRETHAREMHPLRDLLDGIVGEDAIHD